MRAASATLIVALLSSGPGLADEGPATPAPPPPPTAPGAGVDEGAAWAATFPPARLLPYVQPPSAVVMVVAAGEGRGALRGAAAALAAALRASGGPGVVMDDSALGSLPGTESDQSIARAATARAAWQTFVLRTGAPPLAPGLDVPAHLRVIDGEGREVLVAAVRPGVPFSAVLPDPAVVARLQARSRIEEQLVRFTDRPNLPATASIEALRPQLGPHGRRLTAAEYYDLVGRPDLARAARRQRRTQIGVASAGVAVTLAGLAVTAASSGKYAVLPTAVGMGLALAGGAMTLLGLLTPPGPDIGLEQAQSLGERHNLRTLQSAGLSDLPFDPQDLPPPPPSTSLRPTPHSFTLTLSLSF